MEYCVSPAPFSAMEINHQAPLVAQRKILIQASPEAVWTVHTAINDWSQWQPSIDMTKLEGPIDVGSMEGWLISMLKLATPKFLEMSLDTWLQSLKIKAEDSSMDG